MKTPIFFILLLIFGINLYGQKPIYYDSLYTKDLSNPYGYINKPLVLDFNDLASREYILIDTSDVRNVWVFDSLNKPGFLVSDSIYLTTGISTSYDTSLNSSFQLKLYLKNDFSDKWFSSFGLGFIHQYDTDSALDGLTLETSDDGGLTWDEDLYALMNQQNTLCLRTDDSSFNWDFYTYIPNTFVSINSGKSDSLIYSRLAWGMSFCKGSFDSILIKISFKSDNIDSHKAGWAIQKLVIEGNFFESGGGIEDELSQYFKVFNEGAILYINPLIPSNEKYVLKVFNLLGQEITQQLLQPNQPLQLNLSHVQPGIYIVELGNQNGKYVKKIRID